MLHRISSFNAVRRAKVATRMAALVAGQHVRRGVHRLGLHRPNSLPEDAFDPPDSVLCQRATRLVDEVSPAFLFNHCVRTWAFGVAVGIHLGYKFDRELLYLAAIMHDLGLTDRYSGADWFERRGARAPRAFCLDQGMSERRAALVHDAILLHDQFQAAQREAEVALVHFGAGVDVIGFRAEDVAVATRNAVVERWPRLGFKREMLPLVVREAERNPACPIADHLALGLASRVRAAPFAE